METILKNFEKKGLYALDYGYSDHRMLFTATKAEIERYKNLSFEIETSKHACEEVVMSNAFLITEDADFIKKFEELKLSTMSPIDFCEDYDLEEEQFNL
jgi:hypothetical protein